MNEQKVQDLARHDAEEMTDDQAREAQGGAHNQGMVVAGKPIKIPAIADENE